MKYFTSNWWLSGCENSEAVFAEYNTYFDSIRNSLPAALQELEESFTLHDSKVKLINCDLQFGIVTLVLSGWNQGLNFPVRYNLQFSGVLRLGQSFPQEDYVESELGDLGYWELEKLQTGIEMRMLFASTAEFKIVFTDFTFTHSSISA